MTRIEWERWLREAFVVHYFVGPSQIDQLARERKAVTREMARVVVEDRQDADVLSSAECLIADLSDTLEIAQQATTELDAEAAAIRALYAQYLSTCPAYPLGPKMAEPVLRWCEETCQHFDYEWINGSAIVFLNDEAEEVMFKLRWMDELQLK